MNWLAWLALGAFLWAVVWLGCGAAAAVLAKRRGERAWRWIVLGLLLGPVGLLLVLKVLAHQCPHCRAPVLRAVYTCPQCGLAVPRLDHNPVGPLWTYRRDW